MKCQRVLVLALCLVYMRKRTVADTVQLRVENWQTGVVVATGGVERSVVELDTDDRKHDDREEN